MEPTLYNKLYTLEAKKKKLFSSWMGTFTSYNERK